MSEAAPPARDAPAAAEPSAPPADAAASAENTEGDTAAAPAAASEKPTSATIAADAPPKTNKTKEDYDLGTHAGLDDDALQAKMRQAQERLEGLDKHVADLKRRSEEQDAIAKVRCWP